MGKRQTNTTMVLAHILVRIEPDDRIAIFFPDDVGIDSTKEPCVCSFFLYGKASQGWRQVCTSLAIYSVGPLMQNVAVLLQFVQNPMLCGLEGCDGRIAYEKLLGDLGYEWPCEEEGFQWEQDLERHNDEENLK